MPRFQFKVVNCLKSSMDRQIMEAIRISTDGELNSKCEWRQNQLKRISVHLTEREIAKVEKELELESLEKKRALDNLNEKLDSIACTEPINKCVDSNQFQSADITSLNKLSKRKLCPDNQFKAKRSRLNCYLAMPQSIGNIEAKVVGDHPTTTKAPSMMMSFAQAAKSAKIHYMDRFGKTVFKAKNCNEKLELNLNFSNINSSLGSLSVSSRSSASYSSPSCLPIMEPMNRSIEQDLSVNLSILDLSDKAKPQNDSFTSNPESSFNKGADAFATLVENAMAKLARKEKEVNFERLLVQMMDLGVDEAVPSAFEIPNHLNNMGWSYSQFFKLWSVSTKPAEYNDWTAKSLDELGGKGALGKIWVELKDEGKTRIEKRKAPEDLEIRK